MSTGKIYKQYTIKEDAPYGSVNWCVISFLSGYDYPATTPYEIRGFRVYNGYNSCELANQECEIIKNQHPNHDAFVCQIGKVYTWGDILYVDDVKYSDKKLNAMEKTRKENQDKLKLAKEHLEKAQKQNQRAQKNTARERLLNKLHAKGKISTQELEKITQTRKKIESDLDENERERIQEEIIQASAVDYLDSHPLANSLQYGLITFYSPKRIGGLEKFCYKIRGLYESTQALNAHLRILTEVHPNDNIYSFELGKWCPFVEDHAYNDKAAELLNYLMKLHLDKIQNQEKEFLQHKQELKKNKGEVTDEAPLDNNAPNDTRIENASLNERDREAIGAIANFLMDPEIGNRFAPRCVVNVDQPFNPAAEQ